MTAMGQENNSQNGIVQDENTSDDINVTVVPPELLSIRWEQSPWSVEHLDVSRDLPRWRQLQPFARQELTVALTELEVGEVCVTETLGPLVDTAPTRDDRLYLCTQLADEARHVRFFRQYFTKVLGVDFDDPGHAQERSAGAEYGHLFEPELRRMTAAVRVDPTDLSAWYGGIVYYHLITEGVLAFTVLQSARRLARHLRLGALCDGLANVTRDEARHFTFGAGAVRKGVRTGHRDEIKELFLAATPLAARVLIGPGRKVQAPNLPVALQHRARLIEEQWKAGRTRLMRELTLVGLVECRAEVATRWSRACLESIDDYEQAWGEVHPVRRARQAADAGLEELFVA